MAMEYGALMGKDPLEWNYLPSNRVQCDVSCILREPPGMLKNRIVPQARKISMEKSNLSSFALSPGNK
jgi:hypothetical protein